ncbi:MAG: ATP-binding cassette domain-containing protein [Actinobacteria bacterium]|nr:ATP-binding cassette domain-containing protein [Actinomycetota bacterium]
MLLSAAMPPAVTILTGKLISAAQARRDVLTILAGLGFALIIQHSLGLARLAAEDALGRRALREISSRTMRAVLKPSSIAHLEDPKWQDQISRARMTGQIGPRAAVNGLFEQWTRRLTGIASLVIVASFSFSLSLLLLGGLLINGAILRNAYRKLVPAAQGRAHALRRATYLSNLATTARPAKEIRVFGLAGWTVDRFREAWFDAMGELWRIRRGTTATMPLSYVPLLALQVAGFSMVTRATLGGEIDVGQMVIYIQAIIATLGIAAVSNSDSYIEYGAATIPAVSALERAASSDADLNLQGTVSPKALPKREIRFENVRFRYPGRDADLFTDLDLVIPAGHSLAIVGENGAGKTTLVKLLARLYDPTEGRITADGIDLREMEASAWQRRVAAIFQDFVPYGLSAADNIGFGAVERLDDRAALQAAAKKAGALEMIESLPFGWDTILSRIFTGGVDLSGGQWQRIALARALMAAQSGAGVLVLDEPTALQDVRSETRFYERFLELTEGLTTILISHRFSTVRRAERIVVLDSGRIVESGTHEELVSAAGQYATMFNLQAQSFVQKEADAQA